MVLTLRIKIGRQILKSDGTRVGRGKGATLGGLCNGGCPAEKYDRVEQREVIVFVDTDTFNPVLDLREDVCVSAS